MEDDIEVKVLDHIIDKMIKSAYKANKSNSEKSKESALKVLEKALIEKRIFLLKRKGENCE